MQEPQVFQNPATHPKSNKGEIPRDTVESKGKHVVWVGVREEGRGKSIQVREERRQGNGIS